MLDEWRHVGIAPNRRFLHSHLNGFPLIENASDISRCFQGHRKENLLSLHCILYGFFILNFYGAFRRVVVVLNNQRRVHSDVKNLAVGTIVVEGEKHSKGSTTLQSSIAKSCLQAKYDVLCFDEAAWYSLERLFSCCASWQLEFERKRKRDKCSVETVRVEGCVLENTSWSINKWQTEGGKI